MNKGELWDRINFLEQENARLKDEVARLRLVLENEFVHK